MRKYSLQGSVPTRVVLALVAGLGIATAGCGQVNMLKARMALKDAHTAYQQQDYRGVWQLLLDSTDLRHAIGLSDVPHWTTIQKSAERLLRSDKIQKLLETTVTLLRPTRRVKHSAADSTGFEILRLDTIPFSVEGELAVDFHAGEVSGTVTWVAGGDGDIYVYETRENGKRHLYPSAVFSDASDAGATTSAQVVRTRPGLPPATCADARNSVFGELTFGSGGTDTVIPRLLAPPVPPPTRGM